MPSQASSPAFSKAPLTAAPAPALTLARSEIQEMRAEHGPTGPDSAGFSRNS
jgi:hypothetical protein